MITTTIANPADWAERLAQLMRDNWAETGFDFEFAPDVAAYDRLHAAGLIYAVIAMDGEQVAGYCIVLAAPHLHNPAVVVAGSDALYVAPAYRNGRTAPRLINEAEAEAKRRGAHRFTWHCRAGTPLAGTLTRRGYQPVDNVVMRGL